MSASHIFHYPASTASFYNAFLPSPSSIVTSPAYLMSPNGAYALYLSAAGDLALYTVDASGALATSPYWQRGNRGIWVTDSSLYNCYTGGCWDSYTETSEYETTYDLT